MEALIAEHELLAKSGTLRKSVGDVQKTIDILVKARERIAAGDHLQALSIVFSSHVKKRR